MIIFKETYGFQANTKKVIEIASSCRNLFRLGQPTCFGPQNVDAYLFHAPVSVSMTHRSRR